MAMRNVPASLLEMPMFPLVPAPFQGSTPQDGLPYFDLPRVIDRVFGCLALGAAFVAGAAGARGGAALDWPASLAMASLATLVVAAAGIWVMEQAAAVPRTFVAGCSAAMQDGRSAATHGAPAIACEEKPSRAFFGLLAEGASRFRAAQAGWARLKAGRQEVRQLTVLLRSDGACLAEAASGIMAESARLADGTAATLKSAAATGRDVGAAIDAATRLAADVRATNAEVGRMARCAIQARKAAAAAQSKIATLDAAAAALAGAIGRMEAALRTAETAAPAGETPAMANAIKAQAAAMRTIVAGLRAEAGEAATRLTELGAVIQAQQVLGAALSDTLDQRNTEIRSLFDYLSGASDGLATLRAAVASVSQSGTNRLAEAEALRGAAGRLPGHADTIANLLRSLPDFASGLE